MIRFDPATLPWLVRPAAEDTAALDGLRGATLDDLPVLLALAQRGWAEPALRRLGRRFAEAVTDAGGCRAAAQRIGAVPCHLLVVSAGPHDHLADPIRASGLRHGLMLGVTVLGGQEPLAALDSHRQVFLRNPPDAALLMFAVDDLTTPGPLGDAAAAEAAVNAAIERLAVLVAGIQAVAPAAAILVTTSPLDFGTVDLALDIGVPGGPRARAAAFDRALATRARNAGWYVFDTAMLAALVGTGAWGAGRWRAHAGSVVPPAIAPLFTDRLTSILAALHGRSRRVLVLDLDDTLWGGIVGDDGPEGLALSPGDPRAAPHRALQHMARELSQRGILLAISSKNDPPLAREVFRTHPDMVLREDDIAAFEIGWDAKPLMIRRLSETFRLGLDSFVFIDDQPAERHDVRTALPDVAVPELPVDPTDWSPILRMAGYFEKVSITAEDRARNMMQRAEAERTRAASSMSDRKAFLLSLGMTAMIGPFDTMSRPRLAQLFAKSNQFNLTARRYSESEITRLACDPKIFTVQVRLADRFGDSGLIAAAVCEMKGSAWEIESFVMSCRVIGRRVEDAVLAHIARVARRAGAESLVGLYRATARNGLVADLYAQLGFAPAGSLPSGTATWWLDLGRYRPPADLPIDVRVADPIAPTAPLGDGSP